MLLFLSLLATAQAGTMQVHMLDVGQGDSILLQTPAGKNILIDAGKKGALVYKQLATLGVRELELVVTSHAHTDHMGGMEAVVRHIPIALYLDSGLPHTTDSYASLMEALVEVGVSHRNAEWGEIITLDDGITVKVLWPGNSYLRGTRSDLNSNSVVLQIDHGEDCFLFMGDAEDPTEVEVSRGGVPQCDVLKVAHHGSDHSSSAAFLRQVDPDIALISSGEDNRYGHPGELTLETLQRQEVAIYRTDFWGQITLASTGQGIQVSDGRPWWSPNGGAPALLPVTPPVTVPGAPSLPQPVEDPMPPSAAALSGIRNVEDRAQDTGSESTEKKSRRNQSRRNERRERN
ncbi:MAG: competence protein ComEC [Cognaticolwellia sp.]